MQDNNTRIENNDPYFLLGVSLNGSDDEIQASFHKKMQSSDNQDLLVRAYTRIRTQTARNHLKWNTINSFILDPFNEISKAPE